MLVGDTNTKADSRPKVIPQLQNKSIISVVIGDYHNAALTANGKLLTWGAYSNGALGLGDPLKLEPGTPGGFSNSRDLQRAQERGRIAALPPVDVPTEVRFDHNSKKKRDRFCFAATASGWHTGALVIDLEVNIYVYNLSLTEPHILLSSQPGVNDDEIEESPTEDLTPTPTLSHSQWETPPIIPPPGIRLGHAARGTFGRGRGGLHQPDNGGDTL